MHSFEEERLFVISDIHIGNPSFTNKNGIIKFLDFVIDQDVALVINGDGIDFLQPSMQNFISVLPEVFKRVVRISQKNTVYYVIGNHDIYFEQFLFDMDTFKVVPFLNIRSEEKNIRIEHAHVYDDLYIHHPKAYFLIGKLWGYVLKICPALYPTYELLERVAGNFRVMMKVSKSSSEEKPVFKNAATLILERGFDVVVFGHTHRSGESKIDLNKYYYNTGAWFYYPHYLEINKGEITLHKIETVTS
jgi:UDP-2,3-diacylglucosamine pyrophosphatase LpxH